MSGGIDSSVSAFLLKENGYEVMGVHFRLSDGGSGEDKARLICERLKIKFYPVNISRKFKKEVVDYFVSSYEKGETPNPCTRCNKVIKFSELVRLAHELGFEYVATGHYARVERKKAKSGNYTYILAKGQDSKKDQSYFLYRLGQEELQRTIFPLGKLAKDEIRKIAEEQGFPEFRSESQDVCFLLENGKIIDHNEFLKKKINLAPGPINLMKKSAAPAFALASILEKGGLKNSSLPKRFAHEARDGSAGAVDAETIGQHQGLPLYTIGQRKGVEIGGTGPYYVVKADYQSNTLFVTNDPEDEALYTKEFFVREVNWVAGVQPELPLVCEVMVRYRGKPIECAVELAKAHSAADYSVKLKKAERAVTFGQSAVFYHKEEVLGGGIIYN